MLQVSFVGMTEEQVRDKAQEGGWADKVAVSKTSFKANSKALAEKEGEGMAKLIYRRGWFRTERLQPACPPPRASLSFLKLPCCSSAL